MSEVIMPAVYLLAIVGYLLFFSILYGALVGRNVQECAKEAAGFASLTGMLICVLLVALWRIGA